MLAGGVTAKYVSDDQINLQVGRVKDGRYVYPNRSWNFNFKHSGSVLNYKNVLKKW